LTRQLTGKASLKRKLRLMQRRLKSRSIKKQKVRSSWVILS
jgi:hypothetical protein